MRIRLVQCFLRKTNMMTGVLSPRESGRLIAETSKDVSVHEEGVRNCAKHIFDAVKNKKRDLTVHSYRSHELHPQKMNKAAAEWVFVVDTLNFNFWSENDKKKFTVKYKDKSYTGYWSLCAAINRALDEGVAITDPSFYASVTRDELAKILRSDSETQIPMLDERLEALHEAGKMLIQKYDGSFVNCVQQCGNKAQNLVKLVVTDFPMYRDEADYNGKRVSLYKRAQILVADLWGCFGGEDLGEFDDIDTITMFADYRVPQSLVYFGAMKYSDQLMDVLHKDMLFKSGDRMEVEIRGCSIWATELITEECKKLKEKDESMKDVTFNAILIDNFLWDLRRELADEMKKIPFHKIRCIYY
ncbi:queuosine salvage protein-like [Gigantopelta aegis]|uniref:queuosine salvage protein-like n=1 Tax=Gigantopelta aegis TaxID=1735272 RepID=UPI001B88E338|nr:queuosine salvage protein-like [Gigantopelta aegis]